MIVESLRILLFGMAGIFVVMGVIVLALHALIRVCRKKPKAGSD